MESSHITTLISLIPLAVDYRAFVVLVTCITWALIGALITNFKSEYFSGLSFVGWLLYLVALGIGLWGASLLIMGWIAK